MENTKSIPYYDFVKKLFNRTGDPSKDFAHCILGIVTEIHEYYTATDKVNAIEELGDMQFYLVALAQVVEEHSGPFIVDGSTTKVPDLFEAADKIGIHNVISGSCNTLLDDAKRWVGYGKEPKSLSEVFNAVSDLVFFVSRTGFYPVNDTDADRIKLVNMAKLLKRYPGGEFSAYHAVVRDLAGERAVLESH